MFLRVKPLLSQNPRKDLDAHGVAGYGRLTLSFPHLIYSIPENHRALAGDLPSRFSHSFYPE